MKSTIFIPEKINVGYQKRSNAYTQKLAYIIYFDEKGALRKETSWQNWRDKELGNDIHENVPTEGFVLNKKVGDYVSDWNHRQAYVRVYDPRGFEFEITIENLLFILENANSIKGKGLEGEFVYGWNGKELVLIPTESPDYKEISEFNKVIHNRVKLKGKDLKIGGTYLIKSNNEIIYLGRFDFWDYDYGEYNNITGHHARKWIKKGKKYFFVNNKTENILTISSLSTSIINVVSEECIENYADLIDKLEKYYNYSPIDNSKDEWIPYTEEDLQEIFNDRSYKYLTDTNKRYEIRYDKQNNNYYYEVGNPSYQYNWGRGNGEPRYIKTEFESLKELIEIMQPVYLRQYLANGKLYSEGK